MTPPKRIGLIATVKRNPSMAEYGAYLGTDSPLTMFVKHTSDGYEENRPLKIESVQRQKYPNPHIVKGVLELDANRPGQDPGDMPYDIEVVIEVWSYPRTYIYSNDEYIKAEWACIEDIVLGELFQICPNGVAMDTESTFQKFDNKIKNLFTGEIEDIGHHGSWIAQLIRT